MYLILIVILVILVIGGLPHWPYAQGYSYGYYPSGLLGIVLVILLVLFLMGRL
jgi:hypothetical protein